MRPYYEVYRDWKTERARLEAEVVKAAREWYPWYFPNSGIRDLLPKQGRVCALAEAIEALEAFGAEQEKR